jgi:hypothetical protein
VKPRADAFCVNIGDYGQASLAPHKWRLHFT